MGVVLATIATGCNVDKFFNTTPPLGQQTQNDLRNSDGAEAVLGGAKNDLFRSLTLGAGTSIFRLTGVFTDEFQSNSLTPFSDFVLFTDARRTAQADNSRDDVGTTPFGVLLGARSQLIVAIQLLSQYEPDGKQYLVGEAYAWMGYIELYLAEDYCAGVPLDQVRQGDGGIEYGMPLTTDSLLGVAEAHFDSALAHAHGDPTVTSLASVGLGRTRLNRGHFAEAAAAVAAVPTPFVYNIVSGTTSDSYNLYWSAQKGGCGYYSVSDGESGNGLNFRSAGDPRLVIDSTITSGNVCQGYSTTSTTYYPMKFGMPSTAIPISTGIEARLIEAEANLHANNATWLADLNTLRTTCAIESPCADPAPAGTGAVAGLRPLTDPGGTNPRVDLVFRERAFWLFGTGMRLGDMRRLIRQYGRTANTVFPTGTYGTGLVQTLPTYGTNVSLALPTKGNVSMTNPHYQGCIDGNTAA